MFNNLYSNIRLWINLIHCTFTHPRNAHKIKVSELVYGDYLFFHGHTEVNKAIQSCTKSKYNHVARYIGDGKLFHAVYPKAIVQSIKDAWEDSDKFVDVYRYHAVSRLTLQPEVQNRLRDSINKHIANAGNYSVPQLLLLAPLSLLRDNAGIVRRKLLDESFEEINHLFYGNKGNEPVTCSELSYRIDSDAMLPVGLIPEGEHHLLLNTSANVIHRLKTIKLMYDANPNFVTPHDLVISPDIDYVAQLERPKE